MAKRIFTSNGLTFTASANGAVATTSGYMAVKGASNQLIDVLEVMISGMATASTVAAMNFARVETIETTPTALAGQSSDGAMFPGTTALSSVVVTFIAAGTQPTPSDTVTDAKLSLALNLFGGIVRWNAAPTQQWMILGNSAPGGESILYNSSSGGGSSGLANAHIIYEPY